MGKLSPRGPRIGAEWGRGLQSVSPAAPNAEPQGTVCHPRPPGRSVLRKRPRALGFEWRTLHLPVHTWVPSFRRSSITLVCGQVSQKPTHASDIQDFPHWLSTGKMVTWVQPQARQGRVPTGCWVLGSKIKFKQPGLGLIVLFIFLFFLFVCFRSFF